MKIKVEQLPTEQVANAFTCFTFSVKSTKNLNNDKIKALVRCLQVGQDINVLQVQTPLNNGYAYNWTVEVYLDSSD